MKRKSVDLMSEDLDTNGESSSYDCEMWWDPVVVRLLNLHKESESVGDSSDSRPSFGSGLCRKTWWTYC